MFCTSGKPSYHFPTVFFRGLLKDSPELSIYPGKETAWPIVRFSFTCTQTSPESGGVTAALFPGQKITLAFTGSGPPMG
jgi:hypothetical protein